MEKPSLDYINKLADENEDFKLNIITILKKEFPVEMTTFIKNFHANDFKETANNIHKIKYKFSLLGLNDDFNLATTFENEIKSGEAKLFDQFERILLKIDLYIKTI